MRVLIHDYAGHPFQVQLSRELARRGHVVTHAFAGGLLTPRGALDRRDDDPAGFETVEVPMSPNYRRDKYSFVRRRTYELTYGRELASLVTRAKPDVVISGNTPSEPQWTMIRQAGRLGIPVVSWVQDFYSVAVAKLVGRRNRLLGAAAGAWYRFLDGKCLRSSAAIVAITEDFRSELARFRVRQERIHVIPNWAPLDEIVPRPKDNPWARRHGLQEYFVYLYSGTLAMKHNPDLLRRLSLQMREDPRVRVVVVSEGPGMDFLTRAKRDENLANLVLLPFQPFAEMSDVLGTADVFVSVLEADAGVFSVPSKVLTYLAAGKAVLAAMPLENLAAKIIQDQCSGICVPPDDATAFLQAAEKLRTDGAARLGMGTSARRYAEQEFEIGRVADRFEAAFVSALEQQSTTN